ncbi:MAG: hypothetical protein Q4P13_04665 [Psychrobacter sp.]|nr:hypothetical protein [Psychrobacter sp.]
MNEPLSFKDGFRLTLVASLFGLFSLTAQAAPTVTVTDPTTGQPVAPAPSANNAPANVNAANPANGNAANPIGTPAVINPNSLAAQLQPTESALSAANQELLSRNAKLQREVNDLETRVNVLVYESKGQLFLYGAFTVLISLLVGIFISWLVFVRRQRW